MTIVRLNELREKQEGKRRKGISIPGDLIDIVDYAQIERDHAEFLRFMIEHTPYILKSQYRQFIGKSRSRGDELIKFLVERNIVGSNTYRGLTYLFPLRKAMVWYLGKTTIYSEKRKKNIDVKGYDMEPSERMLIRNFMKAEFFLVVKKMSTVDVSSILKEKGYPVVKLSKSINVLELVEHKNMVYLFVTIDHFNGFEQERYYSFFILLWKLISVFPSDKKKRIVVVPLLENESFQNNVELCMERALKSLVYTNNKTGDRNFEFQYKCFNTNISRYYQTAPLDREFLGSDEGELMYERFRINPVPK